MYSFKAKNSLKNADSRIFIDLRKNELKIIVENRRIKYKESSGNERLRSAKGIAGVSSKKR